MITEYIYDDEDFLADIVLLLLRRDKMDIHEEEEHFDATQNFTSGIIIQFCPDSAAQHLTFHIKGHNVYANYSFHSVKWKVSFLICQFPYWEQIDDVVFFPDDVYGKLMRGYVT